MLKNQYTDAYFYDQDYLETDIVDESLIIDEYIDRLDKIILEEMY